MKRIIKTEGILTNVTKYRVNAPAYPKNPAWAFITHKVKGHMVTSKNTVNVHYDAKNGHKVTVWYVEGKPEKVYRHWLSAMLLG